jgi:hypothetical protein
MDTRSLKQLMVEGGFPEANVKAYGWGNKACARAHIGGPVRAYGLWRDLSNDEECPLIMPTDGVGVREEGVRAESLMEDGRGSHPFHVFRNRARRPYKDCLSCRDTACEHLGILRLRCSSEDPWFGSCANSADGQEA